MAFPTHSSGPILFSVLSFPFLFFPLIHTLEYTILQVLTLPSPHHQAVIGARVTTFVVLIIAIPPTLYCSRYQASNQNHASSDFYLFSPATNSGARSSERPHAGDSFDSAVFRDMPF
ncbi:hypothetical protein EDC04DRAFT_2783075 [Pisolithus marmoratus]|nr:hypothetical protein EDC04DRAFT_2783075 [Pisolithus marmoratus]